MKVIHDDNTCGKFGEVDFKSYTTGVTFFWWLLWETAELISRKVNWDRDNEIASFTWNS